MLHIQNPKYGLWQNSSGLEILRDSMQSCAAAAALHYGKTGIYLYCFTVRSPYTGRKIVVLCINSFQFL